jgi:septal ring factor EnvC (AmiA/AmiB activator)
MRGADRRVGAAAALTLAIAFSFAQVSPLAAEDAGAADPQAVERALELKRKQLNENAAKEQTIQSEVVELDAERERLNARLVETAGLIQRSEAQMTSIEGRLSELEEQEKVVRGSLEQRHGQIAALLTALQRMGRNPPPVLVTRREDALKMVRSAMLLAAAFPDLRDQAVSLATRLDDLQRVMTSIRTEGTRLEAETDRLNDARSRLASLMEAKKLTLADRQSELASVRTATADISQNVTDLSDLIGRLDKTVTEKTGLGAYNEEIKTERKNGELPEQTASAAPGSGPQTIMPPSDTAAETTAQADPKAAPVSAPATETTLVPGPAAPQAVPETEVAVLTPPVASPAPAAAAVTAAGSGASSKQAFVELAPSGPGLIPGSPGRIKPAIPFATARGKLPLPAQGRRALAFGERTQFGGLSKGIVIETRFSAQVTSPCDGWVVYAGEFRSYGQLLIINAGDGYHVLLAGLSQIDVQPGQFVLAAEPVGTMNGGQKNSPSSAHVSGPVLYVELRRDGRPIDPDPWWASGQQKVQG